MIKTAIKVGRVGGKGGGALSTTAVTSTTSRARAARALAATGSCGRVRGYVGRCGGRVTQSGGDVTVKLCRDTSSTSTTATRDDGIDSAKTCSSAGIQRGNIKRTSVIGASKGGVCALYQDIMAVATVSGKSVRGLTSVRRSTRHCMRSVCMRSSGLILFKALKERIKGSRSTRSCSKCCRGGACIRMCSVDSPSGPGRVNGVRRDKKCGASQVISKCICILDRFRPCRSGIATESL